MVGHCELKWHFQSQGVELGAQVAAHARRVGAVGNGPVRRLRYDVQYHVVEHVALVEVAVAVGILHAAVVGTHAAAGLYVVDFAYVALDGEVGFETRARCKRVFYAAQAVGVVADILAHQC